MRVSRFQLASVFQALLLVLVHVWERVAPRAMVSVVYHASPREAGNWAWETGGDSRNLP